MTDPSATFALKLTDETSGAAENAAGALERLQGTIDDDTKALRNMQRAMRALKGGTTTNVAAFRELRDKITAQKASIADAQSRYVQLGGTFGKTNSAARQASGGFNELLSSAQRMPGPLGGMVSRLGALRGLVVGGGIASGILLIVAASVALTAATIAATAALLRYGVAQSDARRSELLRLEGLASIRRWHGLAAASGTELQAAIDGVSDSTAASRGDLERYTAQLHRMGLRGANLTEALEGMAIVASVQGDGMARRFAGMAAGAARAGGSVRALADDVRSRLGGLAARRMLSLDVQTQRLHQNLERLFSGLRLEGFLSAIRDVADLFSQSTVSGRALKAVVEAMLQPLIDTFEVLGPLAREFFSGMVIGALILAIQIVRLQRFLKRTFGDSEILGGIDAQRLALYAGVAVVGAFAGAVLVASVVLAGLAAIVVAVTAATALFAAPLYVAAAAVGALVYAGLEAYQWFAEQDWAALGSAIADGIVNGLRAGADRVGGAMRELAGRARSSIESALDMHSPSRVFAELGMNISRGLADGVDAGSAGVESSVGNVVSVPQAGAGGGASISIGDVHLHAQEGQDGRAMATEFVDELVALLEGVGLQMGAPT